MVAGTRVEPRMKMALSSSAPATMLLATTDAWLPFLLYAMPPPAACAHACMHHVAVLGCPRE